MTMKRGPCNKKKVAKTALECCHGSIQRDVVEHKNPSDLQVKIIITIIMVVIIIAPITGAYSGPHERRLLHDLMDQYNKVNLS